MPVQRSKLAFSSPNLLMGSLVLAFLVLAGLALYPVTYKLTRIIQLIMFVYLLAGCLCFWWKKKFVRWAGLAVVIIFAIFMLTPGGPADPSSLRPVYVHELKQFIDVPYVWGGENSFGIDCSGLARRAFIRALLKDGLTNLNSKSIRYAASLWWNDLSARALGELFDGKTQHVSHAPSILASSGSNLLAGDMAITPGGMHVLIYLGHNEWIEADPVENKVITLKSDAPNPNAWLQVPITVVRWRALSGN